MAADVRLNIVNRTTGELTDMEYIAMRIDDVIANGGGTGNPIGNDLDGGDSTSLGTAPTEDLDGGDSTTL